MECEHFELVNNVFSEGRLSKNIYERWRRIYGHPHDNVDLGVREEDLKVVKMMMVRFKMITPFDHLGAHFDHLV